MNTLRFRTRCNQRRSHRRLSPAVRRALRGQRPALCLGAALLAASLPAGGDEARAAGTFPAMIGLRSLLPAFGGDGSAGFALKGIDEYDSAGISVSRAADVNGDGIEDLMIGAVADTNRRADAGESYVVFGRATAFSAAFDLRRLHPALGGDGSEGFILEGIDAFDLSGWSVNGVGDANGDGIDDLIIGAPKADPNGRDSAGESYVVFGRTTGFLRHSSCAGCSLRGAAMAARASPSRASTRMTLTMIRRGSL